MKNYGEIIVIDDDPDDLAIFMEAAGELGIGERIIAFGDSTEALGYLRAVTQKPFLVICDINMPKLDGFQLLEILCRDCTLSLVSTPFVFLTTSANQALINRGFGMNIHGYFVKPGTFTAIVGMLKAIIGYWAISSAPDRQH